MKILFKIQFLLLLSLSFVSSGKVDYYLCFEQSGTIDIHLKGCHDEAPSDELHYDDHQEENCSDQLLGSHEQLSSLLASNSNHSVSYFIVPNSITFALTLPSRAPPSNDYQSQPFVETSQQKSIKTTILLI